jgi:hypothetical protein
MLERSRGVVVRPDARRNVKIVLQVTKGKTGWSIQFDLGPVKLSLH